MRLILAQKIIATLEERIAKLESRSNAVTSNTKLSYDAPDGKQLASKKMVILK